MKNILIRKFIGIPVIIWFLQLLYVALVVIFFVVFLATKESAADRILFVIIVVIINILWRLVVQKKTLKWF